LQVIPIISTILGTTAASCRKLAFPGKEVIMTIALVILGVFIGGYLHGFSGALMGSGLGYLIASLITLHHRLHDLEKTVAELRQRIDRQVVEAAEDSSLAAPGPEKEEPDFARQEGFPCNEETFAFGQEAASYSQPAATNHEHVPGGLPEHEPVWHKPAEPASPVRDILNRFLTSGSLLVKTGVVVLFFGVSFLVKYAAEHDLLPIELRLSAAAVGGIAMLGIGWRLRLRRGNYAHVLQGGGIGILYLSTFAALRLYELIPPSFAFAILVAVALLSSILAVLQNARWLAVLGVSGGFLAPVLTSAGEGSHIVLFSYYALLNAGIIGIAWFNAWRILNLIGFAFTFIIGALWGYRYYQPEYFATTEPFLILNFIMYSAIAVLFAIRREPELKGSLDGTLVFGTPIVAFALQAMLVGPYQFGLAWSALALGLGYLSLSRILFLWKQPFMRTLIEAFFAFGVVFCTMAIPLALENRWTSAAWALEGAGILWAGVRQQRRPARGFGMLLLFGAGMVFLYDVALPIGTLPVLNGFFPDCALLAATGLFGAGYLYRNREQVEPWEFSIGIALFVWGLLWWFAGGLHEIGRYVPHDFVMGSSLLFLAVSSTACQYLEGRLSWPWMAFPALGLLPALFLSALGTAYAGLHPFAEAGFAAWPVVVVAYYRILSRHDNIRGNIFRFLHAGVVWLLAGLCAWELNWQVGHWVRGADTWQFVAWGVGPALMTLLIATTGRNLSWPIVMHLKTYLTLGVGPIALAAWLWTIHANLASPGDAEPLPYLPILNPLDLAIGFIYIVLPLWLMRLRSASPDILAGNRARLLTGAYAASLFVWFNAILVRTIHQWGGIEFSAAPLFHSVLLQASLSIFWSLLALCTMAIATRKRLRTVWLTGAGLLVVVVIKLFLVDLSNTGTVERIVSFVGVGILLLIIGYVSPVPPRNKENAES
jgi:uncharacterized membrane protein